MLTLSYIPNCEYLDLLCQFGGKYLGYCLQTLASIRVLVMLTSCDDAYCVVCVYWRSNDLLDCLRPRAK